MSVSQTFNEDLIEIEKKEVENSESKSASITEDILKKDRMQKLSLLILGLSTLNVWNILLQLNIKPIKYFALYMSGLVISSITSILLGLPRFLLKYFLAVLALLSLSFQIGHSFLDKDVFDSFCMIVLFCIGCSSGAAQTISVIIGANLRENFSGFVSAGFGLSSVISFFLSFILDFIVSPEKRHDLNTQKLIILYIYCEIVLIIAIIFSIIYLDTEKKYEHKNHLQIKRTYSYFTLFKNNYKCILCEFLTNWLTLQIFPAIGFLKWEETHHITDMSITILVGMFQLFDFVSRYIPNISHIQFFKIFMLSTNQLLIGNCLRFLFIGWFIINAIFTSAFFGNMVHLCFCMALFAFTNGWFCTLAFTNFVGDMKGEKNDKDIEAVSNLIVISLYIGLCSGLWTSFLYNLIL